MKKAIIKSIVLSLLMAFIFAGCTEPRYEHQDRRRSDGYYHRHNETPPPRVHVLIHN